MCVYSMVLDYGRKYYWPNWDQHQPYFVPTSPSPYTSPGTVPYLPPIVVPPAPDLSKILDGMKEFQKLMDAAKRTDDANGDPDCEDPEKLKWREQFDARLAALEAENAKLKTQLKRRKAKTIAR